MSRKTMFLLFIAKLLSERLCLFIISLVAKSKYAFPSLWPEMICMFYLCQSSNLNIIFYCLASLVIKVMQNSISLHIWSTCISSLFVLPAQAFGPFFCLGIPHFLIDSKSTLHIKDLLLSITVCVKHFAQVFICPLIVYGILYFLQCSFQHFNVLKQLIFFLEFQSSGSLQKASIFCILFSSHTEIHYSDSSLASNHVFSLISKVLE